MLAEDLETLEGIISPDIDDGNAESVPITGVEIDEDDITYLSHIKHGNWRDIDAGILDWYLKVGLLSSYDAANGPVLSDLGLHFSDAA